MKYTVCIDHVANLLREVEEVGRRHLALLVLLSDGMQGHSASIFMCE